MKIYLSPSSQDKNIYAAKNTNEEVQCNRIAEFARIALLRCGLEAKKAPQGQSMYDNVAESNAWGADLHIPVHTNAGGGDGTLVMVLSKTAERMKYAQPIYNALAAVSPGKDDGIRAVSNLYEINRSRCICVYVECEFHDDPALAEWIVANAKALGEALAKGVCDAAGVEYIGQVQPPGPWYEAAQKWAVAQGITDGSRPLDAATRAEVWQMMYLLSEK